MTINKLFQQLCSKEEVVFADLWGCFVGRADMFMHEGWASSKRKGYGNVLFNNMFGSKHCLKYKCKAGHKGA